MIDEFGQRIPDEVKDEYDFNRTVMELGMSAVRVSYLLSMFREMQRSEGKEPVSRMPPKGFRRKKGEKYLIDRNWEDVK